MSKPQILFVAVCAALFSLPCALAQAPSGNRHAVHAGPPASTSLVPQNLFWNPVSFAVGSYPVQVVAADFNGDGKLDLAVLNANCQFGACTSDGSVSILISNGNGTFKKHVDYTVGLDPLSLAVGDFNGDGKLDLVVANYEDNDVSVLLGNGDGTFQTQTMYGTGNGPAGVVVGDFNGDGKLDIATANYTDSTVSVLLGNGAGKFNKHIDSATTVFATHLVVGDFNGDGILDLVVDAGNTNQGNTLLGYGDGTFQPAITNSVGYNLPYAADFNNDGHLDVAVALGAGVTIYFGRGDGTFPFDRFYEASTPYPDGVALAAGDFTGDGITDLVILSFDNTLTLLIGNGDGTFQTGALMYGAGDDPLSVVAADFNGDGKLDLALTNFQNNSVSVVLGNGDGTFPLPREYASGNNPASVAVGDFNHDGNLDIVATDSGNGADSFVLSVYLGNGDGTFQKQVTYGAGDQPGPVVVADFNGDGILDIATADDNCPYSPCPKGDLYVLLGNGDGTFHKAAGNSFTGIYPNGLAAGDFNGDGKTDLVAANLSDRTVSVFLGKGDGSFYPQVVYSTPDAWSVAVGDFNRDGKLDLAVSGRDSVSVLLGNGDGSFQLPVTYSLADGAAAVTTADFNGDGKLDLAVTQKSGVAILLGNGDGSFQPAVTYSTPLSPVAIVTADFNGDGKPDLATTNSNNSMTVLLGKGDGTLQAQATFGGTYYSYGIAAGDFNGDGRADLVAANLNADTITVWLNATATNVTLTTSPNPSVKGQSVTLTATVAGTLKNSSTPTGSITFYSNGASLGAAGLMNGIATFATTALPVGNDSITAQYSGSAYYTSNQSGAVIQTVNQ
jgi:hypothetical protein